MNSKIGLAKGIAHIVHEGQKRQDGEDYINHCARIVKDLQKHFNNDCKVNCDCPTSCDETCKKERHDMICAAWLHDCIEDADLELEMNDYVLKVFGYDIWDIVIALTHDKKLELYNNYITKVFQHPNAWIIKWLDMIDNTTYNIPVKQKEKYRDACIHLLVHGVTVPAILRYRLGLDQELI